MEDNKMKNVTDFEDLLKKKYGEKGTAQRDKYDSNSLAFRLGVMLKKARTEAQVTQEEIKSINRGLKDFEQGKIHSHDTARKIYEKYL